MVDELSAEVFRLLVRDRKPMTFQPAPESPDPEPAEDGLLAQPGDEGEDGGLAARHSDLRLQTSVPSVKLQSRLRKTEHDARTFIEAQGVNTLYLALGMLRWFESASSQEARKAPLVLVPVTLERSNIKEKFRISYTEEDLDDNLSLVNKLKLEFAIELPAMASQEDLDIAAYFDVVERAIESEPRWSLDRDAVVLGFFSFGKLLMYRDLDKENWPWGGGPSDHPIIRSLFSEDPLEAPTQLPEDELLDRHLDPADVHQVMDADSSQTLALLDVKGGRNLVVQGPPGTGKSQTITNVIAEALGQGKTVLFVAEKMAALEVVKRRLDYVGLGDACLELHSRKTNKRVLLQELDRTMKLGRPRLEEVEDNLRLLTDMRDRLNDYSEAMNTPIGESGATPYRAIGELARLGAELTVLPRLDFGRMRHWSGADFKRRQAVVEELQAQLSRAGLPSENPFYGSTRAVLGPTEQGKIEEVVLGAQRSTTKLRELAAELAAILSLPAPDTLPRTEELCRAARFAARAPELGGVRVRAKEWRTHRGELEALLAAGGGYRALRLRYDEILVPEAWDGTTVPAEQVGVEETLLEARRSATTLRALATQLAATLCLLSPETYPRMEEVYRAARFAARAPELEGVRVRAEGWETRWAELEELLTSGERYRDLRDRHDGAMVPKAWDLNLAPTEQERIEETLVGALRSTSKLRDSTAELAAILGLPTPTTYSQMEEVYRAARFAARAPELDEIRVDAEAWQTRQEELGALLAAGEEYRELHDRYDEILVPEAWDQDLHETREQLSTHGRGFLRFMSREYRQARDRLGSICRDTPPKDAEQQIALVDAVLNARRNLEVIHEHEELGAQLFGGRWQAERSEWEALRALSGWVSGMYGKVEEGRLPEALVDFFAGDPTEEDLSSKSADVGKVLLDYRQASNRLSGLYQGTPPEDVEQQITLLDAVLDARHQLQVVHRHEELGAHLFGGRWQGDRSEWEELRALLDWMVGLYGEVREGRLPEGLVDFFATSRAMDLEERSAALEEALLDYRQARSRLDGLCGGPLTESVGQQIALVDAVLGARRHLETIRKHEELASHLFGGRWQGDRSEWEELRTLFDWMVGMHGEVREGRLPEGLMNFFAEGPTGEDLEAKSAAVEGAMLEQGSNAEGAIRALGLPESLGASLREETLQTQESTFGSWHQDIERLQPLVAYNRLAETCRKEGLEELLQKAESWPQAKAKLVDAFRRSWFEGLVEGAFRERPALAAFDRNNHEYVAEKFRELDRLLIEHNRARLAHAHWQKVPTHEAGGQLGVLRREIQKKRRHLPIRQLVSRAGGAVQAIKPVFMMSPLSIANFMEPGALDFDLVIFDEASQVRPVDALGAIARGKQVVVVGDSKQLPPTSFFDRLVNAEEIDEDNLTADLESVLGLFAAQGLPQRMLRWHYRSRHESLITVSNREFYDDRLVVFPSPDRNGRNAGLVYHYLPDTAYDRGGSRSNPGEARRVAQAVMEHARNRPDLSLGVATFSVSQMQAIEDHIEILRRQDPSCEGFFTSHPYEPFFVKNLENVQGDERDVVFISVGYGRTASGHVPMSFGPLNQDGGERRLNVLITRARSACEVFTNLTADDIDLGRSGSRGVRVLKTFLRYAKEGTLDVAFATGREPESPFEESVLSALKGAGYEAEPQVGSAGFFIDLAVIDPERRGRYLLGVECDGATYHSARSARDRDRLRQEVLEKLGWRIHRVWSTDWFRAPQRELRRLVDAIEEAKVYAANGASPGPALPDAEPKVTRDPGVILNALEVAALPPYRAAELREFVPSELHLVPTHAMARWVASVVEVESPVHVKEVSRRIAEAASISRVGSRIRQAIDSACAYAERRRVVRRSGEFLWRADMRDAPLRDRSGLPDASRKVELVAPEEIAAAIRKVISDSFGMDRSEVPSAVLSLLLGFKRTTKGAQQRVTDVLDDMTKKGDLVQEGVHVSLRE